MHNTFVRHLADQLFPVFGRRLYKHEVHVQAAIHHHVLPTAFEITRFTQRALPIIRNILNYLELIDEHCLRLLDDEYFLGSEDSSEDVVHFDVEVNVDFDPEPLAQNNGANGAQNVGAAGVTMIAACNHQHYH